jgi:hypothetical protein
MFTAIQELASRHDKDYSQVYAWWQEYEARCDSSDQCAVLPEFERWYADQLGPAREAGHEELAALGWK